MAGLVRVIYSSSITEVGRRQGSELLPAILAKAVENNSYIGVSGILLAFQDGFLQALEGSAPAVDAVLGKVRDDRRHRAVRVLDRMPITEREFGQWAMCGRDVSATDNAILRVLALKPGLKLQTLGGHEAFKLLKAVKAIRSKASQAA